MDVRDDASVQAMVDTVVKEFGRIDYSVNCAGVSNTTSLFVDFDLRGVPTDIDL